MRAHTVFIYSLRTVIPKFPFKDLIMYCFMILVLAVPWPALSNQKFKRKFAILLIITL